MATKPKQPAGPLMTLGNMRHLGVRGLAVHCLNPQCRHQAVFSVDDYPDEIPVPSFQARMKCGKCGAKGRQIDVRPNWKEQPVDAIDGEGLALMARWRVDIIRKRAEHLGTVEASNANEAIREAIKRFEIPPERQNRIVIEKLSKRDE
jgi:hypothetical protein